MHKLGKKNMINLADNSKVRLLSSEGCRHSVNPIKIKILSNYIKIYVFCNKLDYLLIHKKYLQILQTH